MTFLFRLSHRLKMNMSKIKLQKINGLKEKMINKLLLGETESSAITTK